MKKQKLVLVLLAAALSFCLAFSLVGCKGDDEGDDPPSGTGDPYLPGPPVTIDEGAGWPAAKLAAFTLDGWDEPSGIDGISWVEKMSGTEENAYFLHGLDITFTTATAVTWSGIEYYLVNTWGSTQNILYDNPDGFSATFIKTTDGRHYGVIVRYNMTEGGYINISRSPEPNPLW